MTLSYDAIYSEFLSMIGDVEFLSLDISDATAFMSGWLKTALSNIRIQNLFSSKSYDSEIQSLTFELNTSTGDDQGDLDFVTKVLATGMLIAWLQPKVTTTININQMFGGKEQQFYAQANHLSQLRGLLEDSKLSLNKMIRDRSYAHNTYIEGE